MPLAFRVVTLVSGRRFLRRVKLLVCTLNMAEPAPDIPPVDLSQVTFESVPNRRRIIGAYWVVVLLAIPLWWKTTSIDRLSLPESRVRSLSGKQVRRMSNCMRNSDSINHLTAGLSSKRGRQSG